jgi:hypothetical protein
MSLLKKFLTHTWGDCAASLRSRTPRNDRLICLCEESSTKQSPQVCGGDFLQPIAAVGGQGLAMTYSSLPPKVVCNPFFSSASFVLFAARSLLRRS